MIGRFGLGLGLVLTACSSGRTPRPSGDRVDLVVQGTVQDVTTRREGGLLLSRARLEPVETLAGVPVTALDVELVGGTQDGIAQAVSGGLTLARGEEVVLFLTRVHGAYVAVDGTLAKYRILRPTLDEPLAVREGAGEAPVALAALISGLDPAAPVLPTVSPLAQLTPYVRTTTASAGPGCEGEAMPLAWFDHTVPYVVDAAGSEDILDDSELAALQAAAQTWADVPCSDLRLSYGGTVSGVSPGFVFDGENTNLIVFTNDWLFSPRAIAVTLTTFRCTDGEILDADIVFNQSGFTFTSAPEPGDVRFDVQAIATHELGHFVGFDHNPDPDSTMYATSTAGETRKRTLTMGDELGLCDAYLPGANGSDPRPARPHLRGPGFPRDTSSCGDGVCNGSETATSCPIDCAVVACGDGRCDLGETCVDCPGDCGACVCGDGLCTNGECSTCTGDCPFGCFCGDVCTVSPPPDPSCGDCQAAVCAFDPTCCIQFWHPGCVSAANDLCGAGCPELCGNGFCEPGEELSCPTDCHFSFCGDGVCDPGEDCQVCAGDCGACFCGDGRCTAGECSTCAGDCPFGCFCGDVCLETPPQDASCGACQAEVCALDPSCCELFWHLGCVDLARETCGLPCP